jgi:4-hydroxy-4-methyl-2-oxoglutarate aldolase
MSPASRNLIEQLTEFDTALLANTIGYLDRTPPHEFYMESAIASVTPSLGPTVGVAVTCELDSSTPGAEADFDSFWPQLDFMQSLGVPIVWVVKAAGSRPGHECILGDGMAKMLHACGCGGVVTDGGVRDVRGLESIPFAAYSKGKTVHHCALRMRSVNQPVAIGGITVTQGDVIHANYEGVIRIPRSCLEALPEAAVRMRACEHEAHLLLRRTDLKNGEKRNGVDRVFEKYGFSSEL